MNLQKIFTWKEKIAYQSAGKNDASAYTYTHTHTIN